MSHLTYDMSLMGNNRRLPVLGSKIDEPRTYNGLIACF